MEKNNIRITSPNLSIEKIFVSTRQVFKFLESHIFRIKKMELKFFDFSQITNPLSEKGFIISNNFNCFFTKQIISIATKFETSMTVKGSLSNNFCPKNYFFGEH